MASLLRNTSLRSLNLASSKQVSIQGWQSFFLLLYSPDFTNLKVLDLSDNSFTNTEVIFLSNALTSNSSLKKLRMCSNLEVTITGWSTLFSSVFLSPTSSLQELILGDNYLSDEAAIILANSLANNSSLEYLEIETIFRDPERVWFAFSSVLCNDSSIHDTYSSNHTLQQVCWTDEDYQLSACLRFLLRLNRGTNKSQVARQKISTVHFTGDFDMEPFTEMSLGSFPHVIAWMTNDDSAGIQVIGKLYYFLRSLPSLFDLDDGRATKNSKKRSNETITGHF